MIKQLGKFGPDSTVPACMLISFMLIISASYFVLYTLVRLIILYKTCIHDMNDVYAPGSRYIIPCSYLMGSTPLTLSA